MNMTEIKAQISQATGTTVTSLAMVRQLEKDTNKPTEWVSYWDNDNRFRVTMHEEILSELKANPHKNDLAVKRELVQGEKAPYTRFVIITPKNIEAVL